MQNLKSILYMASGILFGLFLAALIWVVARNPSGEAVVLRPVPTEKPLIVYITGAVPRAGVYALPQGARVQDAIPVVGTPVPEVVTSTTELVNINTASLAELDTLPGVGPTTAQKIIDYREQNGPFINAEDIVNVSGIGPGTYERFKDLITVGP